MRKIPTLFVRDEADRSKVTDQVTPGCEWVLTGEGVATRKYDGTCVLLDQFGHWWGRREVKPGKKMPPHYWAVETDEVTHKIVGWEPIEQSSFAKFHAEAVEHWDNPVTPHQPGTYELCGPKINGNPEGFDQHVLVRHADAEVWQGPSGGSVDYCKALVISASVPGWEGIVWHHPDGRMAKLKAKDL